MIGKIIDKRYRIIEETGSGGMGIVYRGEDTSEKRPVAIKKISLDTISPLLLKRFFCEAEILRELSHDNIVRFYSFVEEEESYFIIMEYLRGRNILEEVRRKKNRVEAVVEYIIQLCNALSFAHSGNIIHRDIKPSNIIVTEEGRIKILDFGIARKVNENISLTGEGEILGTLSYLSPEQVMGKTPGVLSDLYSLGILIYELLTDRVPFTYSNRASLLISIISEPPLPPSYFNPSVPLELERIIFRLLSKDPRERYSSAKFLREDLIDTDFSRYTSRKTFIPLRSPTVGRERILIYLKKKLSLTHSTGSVVVLSGERGLGKSRVVEEIKTLSYMEDVYYLGERCNENAGPYELFKEIIKKFWMGEKDKNIKKELMKFPWIRKLADIYFDLIDTRNEGKVKREKEEKEKLFEAMENFFLYLSKKQPLVVVFEDLQKGDSFILDLLEYLCPALREKPVMIVITVDEKNIREKKGWKRLKESLRKKWEIIKLSPLDKREVSSMSGFLMKSDRISPDLIDYLYDKSSGNPFLLEEICRFLLEEELVFKRDDFWVLKEEKALKLPAGIEDIFRRRLDNITGPERETLEYAAVLGNRFDADILLEIYDGDEEELWNTLDAITGKEIFAEKWSVEGEYYIFLNPAFRDVIYDSIPEEKRKGLHRKAGDALLRNVSSEINFSEIGNHYIKAGDAEKSIDFMWHRAEEYRKVSAYNDALFYFKKAYEICNSNRFKFEKSLDISIKLARLCSITGDIKEALCYYQKALELQDKPGNKIRIYLAMGQLSFKGGSFEKSLEFYNRGFIILKDNPAPEEEVKLLKSAGITYGKRREPEKAIDCFEKAYSLSRKYDFLEEIPSILTSMASVYREEKDIKKASTCLEEARGFYRENISGEFFLEKGNILKELHNGEEALKAYSEGMKLFESKKDLFGQVCVYIKTGNLHRELYFDNSEGLNYYDKALKAIAETEYINYFNTLYSEMARGYYHKGEWSKAEDYYEKAIELQRKNFRDRPLTAIYIEFGEFNIFAGNIERGKKFIEKGYLYSIEAGWEKEKLMALNAFSLFYLITKNFAETANYLTIFSALPFIEKYPSELAGYYYRGAKFYNITGNYDKACTFCKKGKNISRRETLDFLTHEILLVEASLYHKKGDIEEALKFVNESECFFARRKHIPGLARSLYKKGKILVTSFQRNTEHFRNGLRALDEAKKYFILMDIFSEMEEIKDIMIHISNDIIKRR